MMKTKTRKNSFSFATHFMFMDDNYWECWHCGQNTADAGHHIFGRGNKEGCEKSVLNYAPLCNDKCHLPLHGRHMTSEGRRKLLEKTIEFLSRKEYVLQPVDLDFLEKYGAEIYKLGINL